MVSILTHFEFISHLESDLDSKLGANRGEQLDKQLCQPGQGAALLQEYEASHRNYTIIIIIVIVIIITIIIVIFDLRMSWVANELVCDGERFYMECVREPPEWFLW